MSKKNHFHAYSVILVILLLGIVLILTSPLTETQADDVDPLSPDIFLPVISNVTYKSLTSALHVLPPLGHDEAYPDMFDDGLSDFLEVEVCHYGTGDGQMELLARGSEGIVVYEYDAETNSWQLLTSGDPAWSDANGWYEHQYFSTIQTADVDGDGQDELLARTRKGIDVHKYDVKTNSWKLLTSGDPAWSDSEGWGYPRYYSTIQTGDIDGDGQDELLARGAGGIVVYKYDAATNTWKLLTSGDPAWADAWGYPQYYSTIQTADVDGDGQDELLGRGSDGIEVYKYGAYGWSLLTSGDPGWSDYYGWDQHQYYSTIQTADVDVDGQDELLARGRDGIEVYKYDAAGWWPLTSGNPPWSDDWGFDLPEFYNTIQTADVDGDGQDELLARFRDQGSHGVGIMVFKYDATDHSWPLLTGVEPAWYDRDDWTQSLYYRTIQTADIDGDGQEELLARHSQGMLVYKYVNTGDAARSWPALTSGDPEWSNALGWAAPRYYSTIQTVDATGCGPVAAFSGPDITLKVDHYHTEWKIAKSDVGKIFHVHFLAAGREIGYVEYTPDKAGTLPVDFGIDNHQQIRAWVLHARSNSAPRSASALKEEFDLPATTLAQLLADAGYKMSEIAEALRDVLGLDAEGTARTLVDAGFSPVEVAEALEGEFGVDKASTYARVLKNGGVSAVFAAQGLKEAFALDATGVAHILKSELGLDTAGAAATLETVGFSLHDVRWSLKEAYGLDEQGVARILKQNGASAVEVAKVFDNYGLFGSQECAQILKNIGYDIASIYQALKSVYSLSQGEASQVLIAIGFEPSDIDELIVEELAVKFAPRLLLDSGNWTCAMFDVYPMSAQAYYDKMDSGSDKYYINTDPDRIENNKEPIYWKWFRCGDQIRLVYWIFYGGQYTGDCFAFDWIKDPAHAADWEHVMVVLSEDTTRIAAVTYFQHGGYYTRIGARSGFEVFDGTHPVVYVGRAAHGAYHNTQCSFQTDCYWEDHRDGKGPKMNSWNNLIRMQPTSEGGEPWMDADLAGSYKWGEISEHPMQSNSGECGYPTCAGTPTWGCHESGCFRSQCEAGDRDDGITCWHCPRGYIDYGAYCVKDCGWAFLCDHTSIHTYGLRYKISESDAGLLYSMP